MSSVRNILLCVSGASGSIYAKKFIGNIIKERYLRLYIIFTQTAKEVWKHEVGEDFLDFKENLLRENDNVEFIENDNFFHKFSSGSNVLNSMVVLPCSMGTLARIAQGVSFDLIGRIADVQLKEKRTLVVVPRETPYNLIHLKNMQALIEAGAIIAPASPSFYNKYNSIDELADNFSKRVLEIANIKDLTEQNRWGN
jgi:polyprenyl P-hydroxybenzoate and phenylacrylic acid decarboxylases